MAPHSRILAWRIPRTEEPDGLWSKGTKVTESDRMTSHAHVPGQIQELKATSAASLNGFGIPGLTHAHTHVHTHPHTHTVATATLTPHLPAPLLPEQSPHNPLRASQFP